MEEILELNYEVLKTIVLSCNWVKANYNGNNAKVKRDEYGFTLVSFTPLISISAESCAFPLHVERVFLILLFCQPPFPPKLIMYNMIKWV